MMRLAKTIPFLLAFAAAARAGAPAAPLAIGKSLILPGLGRTSLPVSAALPLAPISLPGVPNPLPLRVPAALTPAAPLAPALGFGFSPAASAGPLFSWRFPEESGATVSSERKPKPVRPGGAEAELHFASEVAAPKAADAIFDGARR